MGSNELLTVSSDIESQLKPAIEEPHVSTNTVNFPPTVNQISTVVGSEETVSNSLDSVSPTPKLRVKTEVESASNTKSFVEEFFKFLIAFMKEITGIMKSPLGVFWGLIFLLLVHPTLIHGSPLNSLEIDNMSANVKHLSPLDTLMQHFQQDEDFTIYTVESYDAMSFTFPLKEIKSEQFNGMTDACNGISAQHELCLKHPGVCQTSKITTDNFEEAIKIIARSLVDLNRVCEMKRYPNSAEIISRCHQNLTWSQEEFATKKLSFFY